MIKLYCIDGAKKWSHGPQSRFIGAGFWLFMAFRSKICDVETNILLNAVISYAFISTCSTEQENY